MVISIIYNYLEAMDPSGKNRRIWCRSERHLRKFTFTFLSCGRSRIIVGEVRGDEVVDMLQAMNTGMDGSLSTGHGNSPSDMLVRLETMVLMGLEMPLSAVRRQIASGIDILIHLGRLRDKSRRVLEIREVTGYDYESGEIVTSVLYEFLEDGKQKEGCVVGKLHKKEELFHVQKLIRAGIVCQVHGRLT